ncbi:MAG: YajG family lipoprotein [Gammaproteobacteria bacterium]|nr:YajG family lipoprotein [Gammaproteobacteria bacterium]
MKRLIPIILMIVFSGCAYVPQQASVQVDTDMVIESSIGGGKTVFVDFRDERPSKSIGSRGLLGSGEITTEGDLAAEMHNAIENILEKQDFVPVTDNADANLEVQLRAFEYDTSMGFWTGGIHLTALIKVIATTDNGEYDNIYRYEDENRIVFVPFASENEKWLNEMANGLVEQIFKDRALLNHLAE